MWSIDVLLDLGFTPFLAVAAFAWLARRGRLVGALLALASMLSFLVALFVTIGTYPWDAFRFTQSGMTLGFGSVGIAMVDIVRRRPRRARPWLWSGVVALTLIAGGGYLAGTGAWGEFMNRSEGEQFALDVELTRRVVASSEAPPRPLVAPGATDWSDCTGATQHPSRSTLWRTAGSRRSAATGTGTIGCISRSTRRPTAHSS